jgi:hypothetical protein
MLGFVRANTPCMQQAMEEGRPIGPELQAAANSLGTGYWPKVEVRNPTLYSLYQVKVRPTGMK